MAAQVAQKIQHPSSTENVVRAAVLEKRVRLWMRLRRPLVFELNGSQQQATRFCCCTILQSRADCLTSLRACALLPSVEKIGRVLHTVDPPIPGNRPENQCAQADKTAEGQR